MPPGRTNNNNSSYSSGSSRYKPAQGTKPIPQPASFVILPHHDYSSSLLHQHCLASPHSSSSPCCITSDDVVEVKKKLLDCRWGLSTKLAAHSGDISLMYNQGSNRITVETSVRLFFLLNLRKYTFYACAVYSINISRVVIVFFKS